MGIIGMVVFGKRECTIVESGGGAVPLGYGALSVAFSTELSAAPPGPFPLPCSSNRTGGFPASGSQLLTH